jgi:hypothetical protein
MTLKPKLSVSYFRNDKIKNNYKEFCQFDFRKYKTATGFPISPHLRRQMPSRIADYSGTTFSPAVRDFAALNLLICGKLENRSI